MIKPTMNEASELSKDHTIVPIYMDMFADIKTPIEVLKVLKMKSKKCYLLESAMSGEQWGRYSFLGFDPEYSITCKDGIVKMGNGKTNQIFEDSPKQVLRNILSEYKSPKLEDLPIFSGGFVGYISYDYIKYIEKSLSMHNIGCDDFDDLHLMLFKKIIAFDHIKQKIIIIVNIKTDNLEQNYVEGVLTLKEIENIIKSEKTTKNFNSKLLSDFTPLFSKEDYCEIVEKAKEHIVEGDIFQAFISNRMEADFQGDLLSTYRVLRTTNPSPYMFYIDFDGQQIAGTSPETLLTLNNRELSTFPIAGTCPRGKNKEEDERLIRELLQNEKELSKHNMLVDLGRNDLGKISEFGTIKVSNYQEVLKFSHVSHITSTVMGTLNQGLDQLDAIDAVFPSGTLSGVPKIKAIEIINKLEGEKRGIYGGAIGYIDFSGNMDVCIAIGMVVQKNNKVYVSEGSGILVDSDSENEHKECIAKFRAMIEVLRCSQEVE